jgi:hypothetical protein
MPTREPDEVPADPGQFQEVYETAPEEVAAVGSIAHDDDEDNVEPAPTEGDEPPTS